MPQFVFAIPNDDARAFRYLSHDFQGFPAIAQRARILQVGVAPIHEHTCCLLVDTDLKHCSYAFTYRWPIPWGDWKEISEDNVIDFRLPQNVFIVPYMRLCNLVKDMHGEPRVATIQTRQRVPMNKYFSEPMNLP